MRRLPDNGMNGRRVLSIRAERERERDRAVRPQWRERSTAASLHCIVSATGQPSPHNGGHWSAKRRISWNSTGPFSAYSILVKFIQHHCHYDLRKFNFNNRVIPIWNSLSDYVVSAETVNTIKNRLDRFWSNQDVLYDYRADLHGIRNRTIVM